MPENRHVSVLLEETVSILGQIDTGIVVDCTLGFGGHTKAILERFPKVKIIAIDQDEEAIAAAKEGLKSFRNRIEFAHSNFSFIKQVLKEYKIDEANGIIADLGVSSMQIDSETRGFSFRFDAPLDMRMDANAEVPTAAALLSEMNESDIANTIYQYGEERHSRRIARRIVNEREAGRPITTTKQLADLVASAIAGKRQQIHPATRTFQALRIKVNGELDILENFLNDAADVLAEDAVLAVITFHSLEDRIVKNTFQRLAGKCICPPRIPTCVCGAKKTATILTKRPIVPTEEEQKINPRSRSAKLRAIKKLDQ
jgi:16S rRNA (cytosine1402-N4)-methyltransferase